MPDAADDLSDEGLVEEGAPHHGVAWSRGARKPSRWLAAVRGPLRADVPAPAGRPAADREALIALGKAMGGACGPPQRRQRRIPAAYTYFGQFVDHDITFDPISQLSG